MKRWLAGFLFLGVGLSAALPLGAQQGFATNTPMPIPVSPTPLPPIAETAPAASVAFYALHGWFEQEMVDLFLRQVEQLPVGSADEVLAAQLTQYELLTRFPNAPGDEQLPELVDALLQAPIGLMDMRPFVRRLVRAELNRQPDVSLLDVNGFAVEVLPAKLNADNRSDAVIEIQYPAQPDADNPLRYRDTLLATRDALGRYTFVTAEYDVPAFPFVSINSVTISDIRDVNRDGLDEVLFVIDDGQPSERWEIVGVRENAAVSLITPLFPLRVGAVVDWAIDSFTNSAAPLRVLEYRAESSAPNWECNSELPVTWEYTNNFYRRSVALNTTFERQDSLGCTLLAQEPLFSKDPAEAILVVQQAISSYPIDAPSQDRALLTLAMLTALQGNINDAKGIAELVKNTYGQDSWAGQQANALLMAIDVPTNTTLDLCAAMVQAGPQGACDMDGLLTRFLSLVPLTTDQDLRTQLEQYGFPVSATNTIADVGRATRTVVVFDLVGASSFSFAANRDGTYSAEKLPRPPQADVISENYVALGAVRAILEESNPVGAIALVDSLERRLTDGQVLPASARYIRALANDLTGKRELARSEYYALWQEVGETIWGQLAGEHLEIRQ